MPIKGAVLKSGASALTVTGGTNKTFTDDGISIANGVHVSNAAQTDFRVRENITVKVKQPTLSTSGEYSKDKKTITIVIPKILANGKTTFNLIRIERETHPESTAAEAFELLMLACQTVSASDFLSFWSGGSLA